MDGDLVTVLYFHPIENNNFEIKLLLFEGIDIPVKDMEETMDLLNIFYI